MEHEVELITSKRLNHNVMQFHLGRPAGYEFEAGQAIELSLPEQARGTAPFTITSLNTRPFLELTVKIYPEHHGITAALSALGPGEKVRITDPWDSFRNDGPGVFLAGGAGITPFIALLRQMHVDGNIGGSRLYFSNTTTNDVFLHAELKELLGDHYVDVITRDKGSQSPQYIDEAFLRKHIENFHQPFYVCGPPPFMDGIQKALTAIGAAQMVNISL